MIILIILVICSFNAIGISKRHSDVDDGIDVTLEKVKREYTHSNITVDGTVSSSAEYDVRFSYDIMIKKIYVKEGENVEKGEKLFDFDYMNIDNRLLELRQALSSVKVSLSQANLEKKQYKNNLNVEGLSESEESWLKDCIAEKKKQISLYTEQTTYIEQEIETLQSKKREIMSYENTEYTGRITKINATVGVQGSVISYTVSEADKLIIDAEVEQKYYEMFSAKQKVNINSNLIGKEEELKGEITEKSEDIKENEDGSRKFSIKIEGSEGGFKDECLRLGMNVTCTFCIQSKERLPVCSYNNILSESDGKTYVYVYSEEEKKIHKKNIKISVSDDSFVQIISGVKEGELVVVNPKDSYYDGQLVSSIKVGN